MGMYSAFYLALTPGKILDLSNLFIMARVIAISFLSLLQFIVRGVPKQIMSSLRCQFFEGCAVEFLARC